MSLTAALRAVLDLCDMSEADLANTLGLAAGLRIPSSLSTDEIRTAITEALEQ